jgi:hypothetical protein
MISMISCGGSLEVQRNVNGFFLSSYSGLAKVIDVSDTYVKIWWEPGTSSEVSSYEIQDSNGAVLQTLPNTQNTTVLTGLTPSTAYEIQIVAKDASGNIYENAPSVSFTTLAVTAHTVTVTAKDIVTSFGFATKAFFEVATTDDALDLTYSLSGAPAGVSIDTQTGLIRVASTVPAGTYSTLSYTATNAVATDTQTFDLFVAALTGTQTQRPSGYNPGTSASTYGYVEYLPTAYTGFPSVTDNCAIIYLTSSAGAGDGTVGATGLDLILSENANNLPSLINSGTNLPCVVLSPQNAGGTWDLNLANEFIDFAIENYRIAPQRIALVGASQGGSTVLEYGKYYADKLGALSAHFPALPTAASSQSTLFNLTQLNFWHVTGDANTWFNNTIDYVNAISSHIGTSESVLNIPTTISNSSLLASNSWSKTDSGVFDVITNRGLSTTTDSLVTYDAFTNTDYQNWLVGNYRNNGVEIVSFETIPKVITPGSSRINLLVNLKPNLAQVSSVTADLRSLGGSSSVALTNTTGNNYTLKAAINPSAGQYTIPLKIIDSTNSFSYVSPSVVVSSTTSGVIRTVNINFNDRSLPSASSSWNEIELDSIGELTEGFFANDLTDSSGRPSSIKVQYQSSLSGEEDTSGMTTSGMAPSTVLNGFLWNNNELDPFIFDLKFLPRNFTYDIILYSSHDSLDGNDYETEFRVNGTLQTIDSDDNTLTTVIYTDVSPNDDGTIRVQMNKTAIADFGCINGMTIRIKSN